MRELLKEARDILGDAYYDGVEPLSDGTRAMIAKVIKRIDAALSAPEPDAMEVVDRMRRMLCVFNYANGDSETVWELDKAEAAALIASYSRRVPRAMLDEIWLNGYQCKDGKKDTDMAEIAAKYGYKVEG